MWNCICNGFINIVHPEDDADALKYVGLLTVCKILLFYIYIYIYIYIYVCVCVCCAFVALYNIHGTYIEMSMGYLYSTTNTNDVHRSDCIVTLQLLPISGGLILYILLLITTTTTTTSTLHVLGKVLG